MRTADSAISFYHNTKMRRINPSIHLPSFNPSYWLLLQLCSVQCQDIQNDLLFTSSTVMQSKANLTRILNKTIKEKKNKSYFDAKTQKQLLYTVQKINKSLEYKPVEPVPVLFESDVVEAEIIEAFPADLKRVH